MIGTLLVIALAATAATMTCLAVWAAVHRRRNAAVALLAIAVLFTAAAGAAWWSTRLDAHARLTRALPRQLEPEFGYAGSDSCRECHPNEYATWRASYHRSMTMPATPETVKAPFDGVTLRRYGWEYRLEQRGDTYWIHMTDPDWEREQLPRFDPQQYHRASPIFVDKQVVMVTGSHHKQAFWVASSRGSQLCRVPFSYRIDDGRWIPLENDYLAPPHAGANFGIWNDNCIQCHAVAGQPRQTGPDNFDSHVAELGIACESCHGPAAQHVAHQQSNPDQPGDPTLDPPERIINPAALSHQRAAEICGQCHTTSVIKDYPRFLREGFAYRPGDNLHETMFFLRYSETPQEPWLQEVMRSDRALLENRFWKDGAVRITGREFNGLLETACYQRGQLSCLSCHSMHRYADRSDQLKPEAAGNDACTQCHDGDKYRAAEHTHHAPGSNGSLCYNCHMPHTTYGLFKAIHSHRIDSPNAANSVRSGRPNACNLCHLDKTLAWTAQHLTAWYGHPEPQLTQDDRDVAASVLWLLRGDAAQRAIYAWHMGWQPAREVSGERWQAPFLTILLDDPYAAVRNVAFRSLKKLPGFQDFAYDFVATDSHEAARSEATSRWRNPSGQDPQRAAHVLITPDGQLQQETIARLLQQRDDRPVYIAE